MKFPTHARFFRWRPAAWLRITGADAATFLQGQFSNDLRGLEPGRAIYGLWLSVKGKVVADSFVMRGAATDEFWAGSYFSIASVVREKLESFVIADDVIIEDQTSQWSGVTLLGAGVVDALKSAPPEGFVFRGRRGVEESIEWIFPAASADRAQANVAGLREVSGEEMERARIEAGIPAVPIDVGANDLPNEGGLDEIAISYTKGCYLGQEVIARLKSMGQVRRRLCRVHANAAKPAGLPAPLFLGARQVGEVRSAVSDGAGGFAGLAMLSLLQLGQSENVALSFAPDAAPIVRIVEKA